MHEIVEVNKSIGPGAREEAKASCSCQKFLGNEVFAHTAASPPATDTSVNHHIGILTVTQLEILQQKVDEHAALPGDHLITVIYQRRP